MEALLCLVCHTGKTNIYVTTNVEATLDKINDYMVKQQFGVTNVPGNRIGTSHTEDCALTDFANLCFFLELWSDDSSKTGFGFLGTFHVRTGQPDH